MRGTVATSRSVPSATSRARSSPAVSDPPMAVRSRAYTGPVSRPASSAMIDTPVSRSLASLPRSTGAAPRQRGNSEKCTFTNPCGTASSSAGGSSWPNATTTPRSAPEAATSSTTSSDFAGVRTGTPSASAASRTGLGLGSLPRPRRRSGWGTTTASSWPAACSASSAGTASAGVPKKTSFTAIPRLQAAVGARARDGSGGSQLAGAHVAQRLAAHVGLDSIEEQHALDVVDVLLDHACEQVVALEHELVAVEVECPHGDPLRTHHL